MQTPGSSSPPSIFHALLDMPVYRYCHELCWTVESFTWQTAVMVEMLKLQRDNQIPSSVTTEDMMCQLVMSHWMTLSSRMWRSEVESYEGDPAFISLLNMLWEVNVCLKMRDVEFTARALLDFQGNIPPRYRNRTASGVAKKYAAILTEQQKQRGHRAPKLLSLQDVVLQVVPRVFQSFWGPSPTTCLDMQSLQLDMLAVCITQAVEHRLVQLLPAPLPYVFMTRPKRDRLVQSIVDDVRRQSYTPQTGWSVPQFVPAIPTESIQQIYDLFEQ